KRQALQFAQGKYQATVGQGGLLYFELPGRQLDTTFEPAVWNLDSAYVCRSGCGHRALTHHNQRASVYQYLDPVRSDPGQGHRDGQMGSSLENVGGWFPGGTTRRMWAELEELPMKPVGLLQHLHGLRQHQVWRFSIRHVGVPKIGMSAAVWSTIEANRGPSQLDSWHGRRGETGQTRHGWHLW